MDWRSPKNNPYPLSRLIRPGLSFCYGIHYTVPCNSMDLGDVLDSPEP
jgi:hypothetical protein